MPLSPLGLVFSLHTFMLKYYILALFLAAVAGKDQSLTDKWGFCQPHSLQRTCYTHSHSHKLNLLIFPGFTYVLRNTDFKHEPQRGPVRKIIFNSPFTIYHRQGVDVLCFFFWFCFVFGMTRPQLLSQEHLEAVALKMHLGKWKAPWAQRFEIHLIVKE